MVSRKKHARKRHERTNWKTREKFAVRAHRYAPPRRGLEREVLRALRLARTGLTYAQLALWTGWPAASCAAAAKKLVDREELWFTDDGFERRRCRRYRLKHARGEKR